MDRVQRAPRGGGTSKRWPAEAGRSPARVRRRESRRGPRGTRDEEGRGPSVARARGRARARAAPPPVSTTPRRADVVPRAAGGSPAQDHFEDALVDRVYLVPDRATHLVGADVDTHAGHRLGAGTDPATRDRGGSGIARGTQGPASDARRSADRAPGARGPGGGARRWPRPWRVRLRECRLAGHDRAPRESSPISTRPAPRSTTSWPAGSVGPAGRRQGPRRADAGPGSPRARRRPRRSRAGRGSPSGRPTRVWGR